MIFVICSYRKQLSRRSIFSPLLLPPYKKRTITHWGLIALPKPFNLQLHHLHWLRTIAWVIIWDNSYGIFLFVLLRHYIYQVVYSCSLMYKLHKILLLSCATNNHLECLDITYHTFLSLVRLITFSFNSYMHCTKVHI